MPCIVVTPGCPFLIHSSLSLSLTSYFSVSLPLSCLLRASVRVCVNVRERVSACVSLSLLSVTCSQEPDICHGLPPISRQLGGHSLPRIAAAKLKIGAQQHACGSADFVCLHAHRYLTMTCQELTPGLAPSQHPCMQPHFTPTSCLITCLHLVLIIIQS